MTTKFQKKIFINLALIMVLFLTGIIFVFSLNSYEQLSSSRQNNLLMLSSKTSDAFSSLIQDMDAIALHLTANTSIRDSFYQAYKEDYSNAQIYNSIKSNFVFLLVPVDTSRFRISIYNGAGNFISAGIPYSNEKIKEYLLSDAYQEYYNSVIVETNKKLSDFGTDLWSDSNISYLSLYRELSANANMKKRVALIEIQCNYNTVSSILSLDKSDITTLLLDENNQLVYSCTAEPDIDPYGLLSNYANRLPTLQDTVYQDSKNLVTATSLTNGWSLVYIQSMDSPTQLMERFILLTIITAAACLSCSLFVVFLVIKYNTKPLLAMTASVRELSLSSPYLDIDPNIYSDELVNLTAAFNQVVNKLTLSMEENSRARECEMRANLIALQSQMDPHFLYNMLSVIDSYDSEGDFDKIHEICIYMSSMLRYISSYLENTADLDMELTHTLHYLQLMKLRFEDQFDYEIKTDCKISLKEIMVPRLILQPILENCFQHGFKKVLPPWHICLSLYCTGKNDWHVDIYDNGCGFSGRAQKDLCEKLETYGYNPSDTIASLSIGGMGLMNTLVRIRHFLKDDFYYKIFTPEQGGTCIRFGGTKNDEYPSG